MTANNIKFLNYKLVRGSFENLFCGGKIDMEIQDGGGPRPALSFYFTVTWAPYVYDIILHDIWDIGRVAYI